ncbi:uncharacterized protein BJX67DRAFT_281004 [Aspergillus lucknowensis]|uniref:EGF-like domain-containing protein n=1 Tax=Aspergillus lucknowensis TaxID=176173 RepID=A0ABR4M0Q1_9EURO
MFPRSWLMSIWVPVRRSCCQDPFSLLLAVQLATALYALCLSVFLIHHNHTCGNNPCGKFGGGPLYLCPCQRGYLCVFGNKRTKKKNAFVRLRKVIPTLGFQGFPSWLFLEHCPP